jgi:penicillin-binding protein 1A
MTLRARKRRRHTAKKRNKILLGIGVIAALTGIAIASAAIWVLSVAAEAPPIQDLRPIDQGANSVIYAADGSRLGYIQSDEARTPLPFKRIPNVMKYATVAIEDQRFYHHGGVDVEGIIRAAVKDVKAGKPIQGGSTITQQLVRNLYLTDAKRDLARKIKEAKLAEELEKRHTKNWILGQYLNTASYGTVEGRTSVGVEAASQTYYGKSARHLTLDQAALIAGLPQSPSEYNPLVNPYGAKERRNEVLQKMADLGYISQAHADQAEQTRIRLHPGNRYTKIREPYFFDYVEQELIQKYGVNTVRKGGLRVYTTIYPSLQDAGRAAINGVLNQPGDPSSAVVSIDPHNGYVRAMASSGDYAHQQYNLAAQGHRQPGSAFKTFVLTTAVKRGINPNDTYYTSKPLDLDLPDYGHWKVNTYSNSYGGRMSIEQATLQSDNTVFAQLDLDLGPDAVRQTAYDMGITTKLDGIPAEGLGGLRLGVSPLEMADAYATLAAGGIHSEPIAIKRVKFPDGHVNDVGKPKRNRVLTDAQAYEVTKILHQNIVGGTAVAANTGCVGEAAKTGTTDNFNDAWLVGFTPDVSTSVWVGYPHALQEMRSVHGIEVAGGTLPADIWHQYMLTAVRTCRSFPLPTSQIQWEPFSGKYATTGAELSGSYQYSPGQYKNKSTTGATGNSQTGGNSHGYNPNLYAPGVAQKPGAYQGHPAPPGIPGQN